VKVQNSAVVIGTEIFIGDTYPRLQLHSNKKTPGRGLQNWCHEPMCFLAAVNKLRGKWG
jgi:hypothetical protein